MTSECLAEQSRRYWDADARTLDAAAGRDLGTPALAAAWRRTLRRLLPPAPATVLDVGAGTGFLALLAAGLGHRVTAVDSSPGMLEVLAEKASGLGLVVDVVEGDAAAPPGGPFDVVMERNVLWTLPDVVPVLDAWRAVAPCGALLAFEGAWGAGAGPGEARRQRVRSRLSRGRSSAGPAAHHAPFPSEVREALPHGGGISGASVLAAVRASAWGDGRVRRLHRVAWAERRAGDRLDLLLGVTPRYVALSP